MTFSKKISKLGGEAGHLGVEGFTIVSGFGDADVAAGGEDEVLGGDVGGGAHGAEALLIGEGALLELMEGAGDAEDFVLGEFTHGTSDHYAHLACIDEERLAMLRLVARKEPQRHGNARAVEELVGQGDDALHEVGVDDVLANLAFTTRLAGKGAIGKDEADATGGTEVMDHVLHPGEVGIARRRQAIGPAHILLQAALTPIGEIERRIGHDEIGTQGGMLVVEERVGVGLAQVGFEATDGDVHVRHLPRARIGFLSVDRDALQVAAVTTDELGTLHKHATRTAARVIDAALVGFEDLDDGAHDAAGRIEFARVLAFHRGELLQAVFVGAAQEVLLVAALVHLDVGEEFNHFAQTALVELGTCEVLGQDAFQTLVLAFDGKHRVVDHHAHFGRMSCLADDLPACLLGHKEHVLGGVFVLVLLVGVFVSLQLLVHLVELVGDIFQKDETQNHALIFRCIQVATQHVGGFPDLVFESYRCLVLCLFLCHKITVYRVQIYSISSTLPN